ncbi:MAG: hypothetical protein AB8G22_28625 [Saprospiraceae bacterium]
MQLILRANFSQINQFYLLLMNGWLISFSLLFAVSAAAQTSTSSRTYLESQLSQIFDNQQVIKNNDFKSPFLDEINIRTETDEFRLNEQRYQIRFSPTSRNVRRAEEQLHQLYLQEANEELRDEYEPLIVAAYAEILDKYKTYRKLQIAEQELLTNQELKIVLNKLLLAGEGTPRDYLRMERKQQTMLIKVEERRTELAAAASIDWSDWMSVEAIVLKMNSLDFSTGTALDSVAVALIDSEIALETAESKRWFDFVGVEYNNDPEDLLREKASIGASFNLPIYGQSKLKLEELRIEKENLLATQTIRKQRNQSELASLKTEIQTKFQRWQRLTTQAVELETELDDFIRRANQSENVSPVLELEERAARLDDASERLDVELEIYELYLEYLEESSLLFQNNQSSFFHTNQ